LSKDKIKVPAMDEQSPERWSGRPYRTARSGGSDTTDDEERTKVCTL